MASDLAAGARTDLWVELCGDAHLGNFRWYHAPDRRLVFDLNDFDETLPGPFEWDVKRLAASVTVSARNKPFLGPEGPCRDPVRDARLSRVHRQGRRAQPAGSVLLPLRVGGGPGKPPASRQEAPEVETGGAQQGHPQEQPAGPGQADRRCRRAVASSSPIRRSIVRIDEALAEAAESGAVSAFFEQATARPFPSTGAC